MRKFKFDIKISSRTQPIPTLIVTSLAAQSIAFLSISATSRIYTPDQFAMFSIYTSLLTVLLSVSSLKLDQAIIFSKSFSRTRILAATALYVSVLMCAIFSLMFMFAVSVKHEIDFRYFLLVFIAFYLASVFQVGIAIRTNIQDFNRSSRDRFLQVTLTSIFQFLLNASFIHSLGLIAGDIIGRLSGVLSLRKILEFKSYKRLSWKFIMSFLRHNKEYTFILAMASLVGTIAQQLPFFMIPIINTSKDAAAYFLISRIIMAPLSIITAAASQVYYGGLSRLKSREIQLKYNKNLKYILSISALFCLFSILFKDTFVYLLIGKNWSSESNLIIPLGISAVFWTPASALSGTLVMAGRQSTTLKLAIFEVASKFLSIYFLKDFPFIFTAYAMSIVSLALYITTIFRSSESIGISPLSTLKTIIYAVLPPLLFTFCVYIFIKIIWKI